MKRILSMCILSLLLPIVVAETNVSTWIHSDETVNYWANIDTNGQTNIQINGVDWEDQYGNVTVNNNEYVTRTGSSFSVWDMINHIEDTVQCVLGEKHFCSEWNYRIWDALQRIFLPRWEYEQKTIEYEIRIRSLENTMKLVSEEKYCQGKIDTMIEMGLDWVKCGNVTYSQSNEKVIGIEGVE